MENKNNIYFTVYLYKQNLAGAIKMPYIMQRLQVDREKVKTFSFLRNKLINAFQELRSPMMELTIYWEGIENDWMKIKDDDGLLTALKEMKGPVYQLHVTARPKVVPRIFSFRPFDIPFSLITTIFH